MSPVRAVIRRAASAASISRASTGWRPSRPIRRSFRRRRISSATRSAAAIFSTRCKWGSSPDYSRGFSERPQLRAQVGISGELAGTGYYDGWGAHCYQPGAKAADNDPSFRAWTCAEGLACQVAGKTSRIGMCFVEPLQRNRRYVRRRAIDGPRRFTPPRRTPATAGSRPRRSPPCARSRRCARRCRAACAAAPSWLPSIQIGLLMVSMVSFSNGTSTSFSSICLSLGMSSRMPTTPNTRPLPSRILRHSARSLVAKISSKILISSSDRAWRSGLGGEALDR